MPRDTPLARSRTRSRSPRKRDRDREEPGEWTEKAPVGKGRERSERGSEERPSRDRDERRHSRDERERRRDGGRDNYGDRERGKERERNRERERGKDRDRSRRSRSDDHDHDRDREHARSHRRRRSRSTSSDDSRFNLAELGVDEITNEDFFAKAGEFRYWLKTERAKYLDEMSSDAAHKYFRRFVRRWNDGALPRECFAVRALKASEQTRHKWQFAAHRSRVNSAELANVRNTVDRLTHSTRRPPPESHVPSRNESDAEYAHSSRSPTPGPRIEDVIGPSLGDVDVGPTLPALPTLSDRQLAREADADSERRERTATRKAERKSAYDKAEDLVPRATGREGKMAERRAANEENKKFREKDTEVELDEGTLMGDSDPFKAALRAREAAAARRADKKAEQAADLRSSMHERMSERREQESATMEMFKAMAKERFG